ncbi:MAG: hypothetical protein JO037_12880 [Actinobacteria bacterium]|nr:hypothetical protein [Actinomycetota bacterium]
MRTPTPITPPTPEHGPGGAGADAHPLRLCAEGCKLRVELFFDEEAGNWRYRVPALHINGRGIPTREDAEQECLSAIAFALEGDPPDYDTDAESLTFDVNVAPAA